MQLPCWVAGALVWKPAASSPVPSIHAVTRANLHMIEHRAKASFIYFVSLGILAALNAALGGRVSAPFQFIAYQLLIAAAAGGVIWMLVGRSRGRRHGE